MDLTYTHILEVAFGFVFSSLLAMIGYWVRRLEKDQESAASRVERIEEDLVSFRENVAVGKTEIGALKTLIERHIDRTENVTLRRIEEVEKSKQEQHAKLFDLIASLSGDVRELSGMLVQFTTSNGTGQPNKRNPR